MEKDKYFGNRNDDSIRQLLSTSKIKADGNLKFRIMQQIQTENALRKKAIKKDKTYNSIIKNLLTTFAVCYGLIIILCLLFYFYSGKDFVRMPEFYMSLSFIAVIGTVFGLISYLDDKLKTKLKKE